MVDTTAVRSWLQRSLWDVVPRDHRQTTRALRRRQIVAAVFVVVGAVTLGLSLSIDPGNALFYPATFGLAAVWVVGAVVSGPLHLGRIAQQGLKQGSDLERPVMSPVVLGAALVAVFTAGSFLVRDWGYAQDQVTSVTDHADQGSVALLVVITVVNGVAEELFFRGALYAAITRHPVVWSTLVYGVATAATGNVLLSAAALLLGLIVGLQRRASGGILAPIITHVLWSTSMLFILPAIFNAGVPN